MSQKTSMQGKNGLKEVLDRLDTRQLDEDVHLIIGNNLGTFPYSNSLLILDEEVVLIDAGAGEEILHPLKDHVDILINSHYHIDHILGNHLFGKLWVVEEEAGVTSSFDSYKRFAGIHDTTIEYEWLSWFHEHFSFHVSSPTRTFSHTELFRFGTTQWQAVHTPGHSPGHCCFYEPERRLMFSSDLDLTAFGPWYGNPNADLNDFIESIKMLSEFEIDVIATSHMMPIRDNVQQALEEYLSIIFEREERILGLLEKEMTLQALEAENIIYKKEQKRYKAFAWFEQKMIEKHLAQLMESGKVEQVGNRFKAL
ncbi:MAG: MBL fold metallo-hydrolase [Methanomassiliicoccales archaeon]|nr:MAG: MBL fold metallo-hydrolase [Methanomassiliicoccales archaeon]